jgi:type I restriction enzyme M protein
MAKKQTATKEISLEQILMNCRNILWAKVEKADNRNAVLSLAFLKFAGEKFIARRQELAEELKTEEFPKETLDLLLDSAPGYGKVNVFYLQPHCRWSYIVEKAGDATIANILDTAMADIEAQNPALNGALPQKFFTSLRTETKTIKSLIDEINKISADRFHEKDLIGRVYEYFLQVFSIDERKDKGEFYTPKCIVDLIAELIEPFQGKIYDPCCGSGGMFVQSLKFVEAHGGNTTNISVYGQESTPSTYRLAKMNLAIRGISHNLGKEPASSFTNDQHKDEKVDFIMANPPFNFKNWRAADELTSDPRWSGYATPPESNANYAWILHMLSKLNTTDGIAGFLLANGALGADGEEQKIRKQLIKNDKVEAIFVLPREMFYSTDISVTLWILNNNKKVCSRNGRKLRNRENEVLFVDLRTWDENVYEKSYVMFSADQITAVKKIYTDFQAIERPVKYEQPELYRVVKIDEIRKNKYSLVPSQYIEFIDHDLEIDHEAEMNRIQRDMKELIKREKESQTQLANAFKNLGYGID